MTIAVAAVLVSSCASRPASPIAPSSGGPGDQANRTSPSAATSAPATPGPSPGLPGTPAADPSAGDVLRAYERFWVVAQAVDRQPVDSWRTALSAVAGEPLLDDLLDGLRGQHARGVRQYGKVQPHSTVADLSGRRAVVVDCQDASGSGLLEEDTGTIEHVGAARTPVSAVLDLSPGGTWLVTEARYLPDPC